MIDFVNPVDKVLRSSALTGVLVELTGLLEGDCGYCNCWGLIDAIRLCEWSIALEDKLSSFINFFNFGRDVRMVIRIFELKLVHSCME